MATTLTRDMLNQDNPYAYYERGGHDRTVAVVGELFPNNMHALITGSLAVDDIMCPTKDRIDQSMPIPETLASDQIEDWLIGRAVKAVLRGSGVSHG